MTDQQLLERIEQQAVKIAELEKQLAELSSNFQRNLQEIPENIYRRMANAAVNCGQNYGCSLAKRYCQ